MTTKKNRKASRKKSSKSKTKEDKEQRSTCGCVQALRTLFRKRAESEKASNFARSSGNRHYDIK